jgi:DinB superfamily
MMETRERQFVLEELTSSEARLLELVDGLTPQQWNFRETLDRWSIAGIIEHLILFENFILGAIAAVLTAPAEPGKKALAAGKDPLVLGLADTRSTRIQAREALRPIGNWPDADERIAELRKTRARTMTFAAETDADLRNHFFPHLAFGDLDCYQWLVVLGRHGARHALQIAQIKADPAYPRR